MLKSMAKFSNLGVPLNRTIAMDTAYQATDPSKSALLIVTLDSTAGLTLLVGQDRSAEVWVDSVASMVSPNAVQAGSYRNSLTGGLTIGLNINTNSRVAVPIFLNPGYYFMLKTISGPVNVIVSVEYPLL